MRSRGSEPLEITIPLAALLPFRRAQPGAASGRRPAVITVIMHNDANGVVKETRVEDLREAISHEGCVIWVDVVDPTEEDIATIGEIFQFHPLALEDTKAADIRPKIDQYDGYQFIAFYGLTSLNGDVSTHSVDIFISKSYMVTFHDSDLAVVMDTAERWRQNVNTLGNHGTGFLLYSLLDSLIDGYFPVLDDIAESAEQLEATILEGGQPTLQATILRLRRDLLMIRRVAGPERDVMNVLVRRDPPLFGRKEVVYFQDVYDHLLRVSDTVDIYRDMLSSVLDANLSMISFTLNVVVKRLTASSIILMSITLIAGIYGMNFVHMPELDWRFGYPFALGLMVMVGVVVVAIFRRIDWL
jgi:magnesium transporter